MHLSLIPSRTFLRAYSICMVIILWIEFSTSQSKFYTMILHLFFCMLEKCCENFKKSLRSELPCSHLFHHHLPLTYSCPASLQTSNQFQKTCSLWPSFSFLICVQAQRDALTCVQVFFCCFTAMGVCYAYTFLPLAVHT